MKTVLIIDDEKEISSVLTLVFETAGYEVVTAKNGGLGCRKYDEFRPDLVVIDIFMPRKNGIDTITDILKINSDAKIIAMSGGGRMINMDDKIQRISELGVKYISKPFSEEDILKAVDDLQ